MPQMAPLMWITLFVMFTVLLLFSVSKLFFTFSSPDLANQTLPLSPSSSLTPNMNWKW